MPSYTMITTKATLWPYVFVFGSLPLLHFAPSSYVGVPAVVTIDILGARAESTGLTRRQVRTVKQTLHPESLSRQLLYAFSSYSLQALWL